MPFYVFAWLASLGYGLVTIVAKLTSKNSINNPYLLSIVWSIFDVVVVGIIASLNHAPFFPKEWPFLIFAAILWGLAGLLYVVALSKIDVSIVSPLFNLRTGFTVILGAIFLREILTLNQYLLILVMVLLGFFINYEEKFSKKSIFNLNLSILLFDIFIFAIYSIFLKKTFAINDQWSGYFWIVFLGTILQLVTFPLFKKDFKQLTFKNTSAVFICSFISSAASLAQNRAVAVNASISTAIISVPVSLVLVFLFAFFKPDLLEKHTFKVYAVRFIAAAVIIIAAVKLSV